MEVLFDAVSVLSVFRGHDLDMDWEKQEGKPYAYFTYAVCCSEVELDCLTGEYRVNADMMQKI